MLDAVKAEIYKTVDQPAPGQASLTPGMGADSTMYDPDLWEIVTKTAENTPVVACGCPTGSGESTIQAVGVFSPSTGTSAAIAKIPETQGWSETSHRNSNRILDKGFFEEFGSGGGGGCQGPGAVVLRGAVLTKERDNGTTKVHLTLDLRRLPD